MKMPWQENDHLGRELRASRPQPPAELESTLEGQVDEEGRRARRGVPGLRLGLAAAVTSLFVASFAVAGGMAAASSSVRSAFADVARVVHINAPAPRGSVDRSANPAADQYGRKASCLKAAADRKAAAVRAANAKLQRDLAAANKQYQAAVDRAKKRYAQSKGSSSKLLAALKAARAAWKHDRALAFERHGQAIAKANARYKADVSKCPTA